MVSVIKIVNIIFYKTKLGRDKLKKGIGINYFPEQLGRDKFKHHFSIIFLVNLYL
jgi:hypothetical protein